ncbi:MAG: hypothetical protein KKF33_20475 [Alphaproteobacteria bacterium]|nr:hypothetical protein [Alphaproteobacteria bacterium]
MFVRRKHPPHRGRGVNRIGAIGEHRENRPEQWGDESIQDFFRNGVRWLLQDTPDNLYFKTYCLSHNVFNGELDVWRKRDKRWDIWYKKCMEAEESKVALMGARGKIAVVASIFYLKCQHHWQDTHKVEHSGAIVIQTDIRDLTK